MTTVLSNPQPVSGPTRRSLLHIVWTLMPVAAVALALLIGAAPNCAADAAANAGPPVLPPNPVSARSWGLVRCLPV